MVAAYDFGDYPDPAVLLVVLAGRLPLSGASLLVVLARGTGPASP